jgi:hypothetical protein
MLRMTTVVDRVESPILAVIVACRKVGTMAHFEIDPTVRPTVPISVDPKRRDVYDMLCTDTTHIRNLGH